MSNHWILGALAESYAQEERGKAMTTDDYDRLLAEIREARETVQLHQTKLNSSIWYLEALLKRLDEEEHRLAQRVLSPTPIASRKLVVGE